MHSITLPNFNWDSYDSSTKHNTRIKLTSQDKRAGSKVLCKESYAQELYDLYSGYDGGFATISKDFSVGQLCNVVAKSIDFENKVIIVVDDVLNTGRTFSYSLAPFLSIPVKKLQVAVLIYRNYRKFPIAADYKGYELSTTIAEHVEVIVTDDIKRGVYLR